MEIVLGTYNHVVFGFSFKLESKDKDKKVFIVINTISDNFFPFM